MATQEFRHQPVLVDLVVSLLGQVPAGVFVDATVGGGGHAAAVLDANPDLELVGIDRDRDALAAAEERLAPFAPRVRLRHARFDQLASIVGAEGAAPVTAVLFDLGASGAQLDWVDRGFSYRHDAPLDMRMDQTQTFTAAEVVNTYAESDLGRILGTYGDERYAKRIARAIVAHRPIATTVALADIVRDAIPAPARRRGGHPAKRTFQAIRIEVNGELRALGPSIDAAIDLLAPDGRVAVLAYHSGEDRIVKERLRHAATGECICPPGRPCTCGARPWVRLLKRGAWKPTNQEVISNPRAESARLRAAEKLPLAPKEHAMKEHES